MGNSSIYQRNDYGLYLSSPICNKETHSIFEQLIPVYVEFWSGKIPKTKTNMFLLKIRSITLVIFLLLASPFLHAQPIFGPVRPTINQSTHLQNLPSVDITVRPGLARQAADTPLWYDGQWTAEGNAVITEGYTNGAISWTLGIVAYQLSYKLELQNLGNGEAMAVINWTITRSQGQSIGGVVPVHRIKKGSTSSAPVHAGPGTSRRFLSAPAASSSGAGIWVPISIDYTYGFMASNGVYHVIGGTLRGSVFQRLAPRDKWIP